MHKNFDPQDEECLLSLVESWIAVSWLVNAKLSYKLLVFAFIMARSCLDLSLS